MNGTLVTNLLANINAGGGFAGHTDWRLPNAKELYTLVNFGAAYPATFSAFNNACTGECTVTTCSCTSSILWSSTTFQDDPSTAWFVAFNGGNTHTYFKTFDLGVRTVRSGS